jgi:hypothetical protein
MGEAKRRKLAAAADSSGAVVDRDKLARALRTALSPIGQYQGVEGGDCVRYASIGAEALRQLGMPGCLQVGDALWRVGPGTGDVIHHVGGLDGPISAHPFLQSAVFHAWVRIEPHGAMPAHLADFTTWQLRDKGRMQDMVDGKRTSVQFCPDYLWVPEKKACTMTVRQVGNSYDVGVYAYTARPIPQGFRMPSPEGIRLVTEVVLHCYNELLAGRMPTASIQDAPHVQALLASAVKSPS